HLRPLGQLSMMDLRINPPGNWRELMERTRRFGFCENAQNPCGIVSKEIHPLGRNAVHSTNLIRKIKVLFPQMVKSRP
ncbi:MAG: hypothetical protein PUD50_06515, partial [Eubacteriales bacterium]|nr:hypothetical protein [Eubacteriales bacterium]